MVFDRPNQPNRPNRPQQPANTNPNTERPRRVITVGNSNSTNSTPNNSNPNIRNTHPDVPSPWLDAENEPTPDASASFVEYLRWMRASDSQYKDATKLQVLQMAEEKANYSKRLAQLTKRTELIAGKDNTFQVKSSWRIRVGGHRGPESILLPAFDALGMPYIPSSTLRGVARNQAILEIIAQEGISWKEAEKKVAPYFGSLEAKDKSDSAGKVIFLDAYPLPNSGTLAMDMANNIWKWEGNSLKYNPNPNPFLTLKETTFLIGLRLASGCQDTQILEKVKQWLIIGLQSGIGSQINTGYGELIRAGKINREEFFRIEFILKGQLIHGRQKFHNVNQPYQKDYQGHYKTDRQGNLKTDTLVEAEVRSVAFKSMLRYWFRAFCLGVLDATSTQEWEAKLFGAINPNKQRGWVRFAILEGKVTQKEPRPNREGKNDRCGEQQGILTLSYSTEAPETQQQNIQELFEILIWMMFHLGGIGQGARRPYYSRQNRSAAPWWRGSTLIPESDDQFWELPENVKEFQQLFQKRLKNFYTALFNLTKKNINYRELKKCGLVSSEEWAEAIDINCQIIVCSGAEDFEKPYALAILHSDDLKLETNKHGETQLNYNGNLCGTVGRVVKPSPIWIADLEDYQVVTVFGASHDPRKEYIEKLKASTDKASFSRIFPLN